jgi:hypothetical protein
VAERFPKKEAAVDAVKIVNIFHIPHNLVTIQPTGKKIALTEETTEYTIRGRQMVRMHVPPSPDGGWPGMYRQPGINPAGAASS